jgi:NADH-quinone oxidoreductase E subunit
MGFHFSDDDQKEVARIRERLPTSEAALIPVLHLAQRRHGWVSSDVMDAVAVELELPRAKVLATATFYTMFEKKPVGRHHVQVCTNVSCSLKGGDRLVQALRDRLGIEPGQTTPDGRFTLSEVECLAACGTAPAVQIGDRYHESMTVEKLLALIDELEAES